MTAFPWVGVQRGLQHARCEQRIAGGRVTEPEQLSPERRPEQGPGGAQPVRRDAILWSVQHNPDRRHTQLLPYEQASLHVCGYKPSPEPGVSIVANDQGPGGQHRPGVRLQAERVRTSDQRLDEQRITVENPSIGKADSLRDQDGSRRQVGSERSRQAAHDHDGARTRPLPARETHTRSAHLCGGQCSPRRTVLKESGRQDFHAARCQRRIWCVR